MFFWPEAGWEHRPGSSEISMQGFSYLIWHRNSVLAPMSGGFFRCLLEGTEEGEVQGWTEGRRECNWSIPRTRWKEPICQCEQQPLCTPPPPTPYLQGLG